MSMEHLVILGIIVLIFGPRRIPELGNTLGKFIRNFKDSISGVEEATFRKIDDTNKPQTQQPQTSAATAQATPSTPPPAGGSAAGGSDPNQSGTGTA